MSNLGMNIKKSKTKLDDYFSTEEKKRVSAENLKINSEVADVNRLRKKVEELQYALCTALDENDNVYIP